MAIATEEPQEIDKSTNVTSTFSSVSSTESNMMSAREGVQRELDAIKTERRRRQRELLLKARPSRGALATSSTASTPPQHALHADQLSSCPTTLRGDGSTSGESPVAAALAEPLLLYRPETAAPPNVLRMAYVAQSNGHLSPCPEHVMGSFVEKLDLSPWDVSSGHTDELWRQSR